jgi:hypothetical protein
LIAKDNEIFKSLFEALNESIQISKKVSSIEFIEKIYLVTIKDTEKDQALINNIEFECLKIFNSQIENLNKSDPLMIDSNYLSILLNILRVIVENLNTNNQDNKRILNQVIVKLLNFIVTTNNLSDDVVNMSALVFKEYSLKYTIISLNYYLISCISGFL